ncbi:ABC transporter substrate-binding protein [Paraburkholderia sp. ZP32-5]|uniref:ABC transporter substrate-binding protein n=1 Tax=Paraburkholderia sp. ZP32-5 TaxID=2883245 RepID=UPI001F2E888C|nr:ABC transporter substrate-binding protein [Paraburkholderia sp. ZP32-5]
MEKSGKANNEIRASGAGRRSFLRKAGAAGLAALSAPYVITRSEAQEDKRIIVPSYGGSYEETIQQVYARPFKQETGIEVVFSGVPDLARLKAQVMSGRPEWDVFEGAGSWGPAGSQQGLFEPLDRSIVTQAEAVLGKGDYARFYRWVGVPAWNTKHANGGDTPKTFAQLWDTKRFPGRRTLRNRADMVLELALVADGVDPQKLYPLDVDRAFKALARIKPFVPKWAESTNQLTTLLATNEVDFGFDYNARVESARVAGLPLAMSLEQTIIGNETIGVVKGTTRKAAAMKFVAFVLRPDRQAEFSNKSSYLPGNPAAMSQVSADAKKLLPDLSQHNHIYQDDEYWASRTTELQVRFSQFLLS